nr:MAG TPA: hypothetical protein [Caudoviricetes sp.]
MFPSICLQFLYAALSNIKRSLNLNIAPPRAPPKKAVP